MWGRCPDIEQDASPSVPLVSSTGLYLACFSKPSYHSASDQAKNNQMVASVCPRSRNCRPHIDAQHWLETNFVLFHESYTLLLIFKSSASPALGSISRSSIGIEAEAWSLKDEAIWIISIETPLALQPPKVFLIPKIRQFQVMSQQTSTLYAMS